jgi:hypothetical protein
MTGRATILTRLADAAGPPRDDHRIHLFSSIAFLLLTLGGVALSERGRIVPRPAVRNGQRSVLLQIIAAAGAGAAAVHLTVTPEHFTEATSYGVFFALVAATQFGYVGLLLRRPSRSLVLAGIAGNLMMLGLWLLTRTVPLPWGPNPRVAESFGPLDVLASGLELVMVLAGILYLRGVSARTPTLGVGAVLVEPGLARRSR